MILWGKCDYESLFIKKEIRSIIKQVAQGHIADDCQS